MFVRPSALLLSLPLIDGSIDRFIAGLIDELSLIERYITVVGGQMSSDWLRIL